MTNKTKHAKKTHKNINERDLLLLTLSLKKSYKTSQAKKSYKKNQKGFVLVFFFGEVLCTRQQSKETY